MPHNHNLHRSPGKRYHDRMMRLAWACYLGADTAPRLAAEWGIRPLSAKRRLAVAVKRGYLTEQQYKPKRGPAGVRYAPVHELVQEYFVS